MQSTSPETHFAKCGKLHIAYQILGNGPQDLIFVPGFASHLEHQWDEPMQAAFFRRLSSFSRLIRFDKRGHGLSDRPDKMPCIEERMDDLDAVMEATGSKTATLMALSEGGPMAMVWAATHPERIDRLILWNSFARMVWSPEHEIENRQAIIDERLDAYKKHWGTGHFVSRFVPSESGSTAFCDWWSRFERLSMSPGACTEAMSVNFDIDVRDILPSITAPTLVLRNRDDVLILDDACEYLADTIPDAQYVRLPGCDHFDWRPENGVTEEVELFMTGGRSQQPTTRKLVTILMADIVNATRRTSRIGDRQWSRLLDQYDDIIQHNLLRFRGQLIDRAGDGVFAVFDGAGRAIRCTKAIQEAVRAIGMELRAGLHTGEAEVRGDRLAGVAVHLASRITDIAQAGEILVSSTIRDIVVGSGIRFNDRGSFSLKGINSEWTIYQVNASTV